MITPRVADPAPWTGLRRVARIVVAVVAVIAVALAARLLVAPLPSARTLTWQVAQGPAGHGFDFTTAGTATVVPIEVERPACAPDGTFWLAPPDVTSTPWAVVITMRMADTFDASGCATADEGRLPAVGSYLTGTYLDVHLAEPLGGRVLFDGSALVPGARPYP